MSCPVDAKSWSEHNRVTLYPGKVNRWVLARTLRDHPSFETLEETARAALAKWFHGANIDVLSGTAGDAVDGILVVEVGTTRPVLAHAQRREKLDPVPTLRPGPMTYLTVTFNYRGLETSMPWPVWNADPWFWAPDKRCPVDADWMLVEAAADDEDEPLLPARQRATWWKSLAEYSKDNVLGDVQSAVDTTATIVKWGLGLTAAWLLLSTISSARAAAYGTRKALRR